MIKEDRMKPKIEIKFKQWWEDYLDDLATTSLRLLEVGVEYEKVKKNINNQIKEVISDAIEIKIDYSDK
jgi:hypothetical protein